MRILAVNGSPRKGGNCHFLIESFCKGARSRGHDAQIVEIGDLNVGGCIGCQACHHKSAKLHWCTQGDDFPALADRMLAADLLAFASPVYIGQVSGQFKCFLDRWYAFLKPDFSNEALTGKGVVSITTCGAPAEAFASVSRYLEDWMCGFFKMELRGQIMAGDLGDAGAVRTRPELLDEAFRLGASL